jgi:hypothetical protein
MWPADFATAPFPIMAVDPTTDVPYLVVGWVKLDASDAPRPVVVRLDRHSEPYVWTRPLDYLAPGEDLNGYFLSNGGRGRRPVTKKPIDVLE